MSWYLQDVTAGKWHEDSMLQSAVLHQLTVIGEISRALSEEVKERHPEIPWTQMRAFRNIAVHEYFALDTALVLRIARDEIPELSRHALAVLSVECPDIAKNYEGEDHSGDEAADP